jgi:hypothetical protein
MVSRSACLASSHAYSPGLILLFDDVPYELVEAGWRRSG